LAVNKKLFIVYAPKIAQKTPKKDLQMRIFATEMYKHLIIQPYEEKCT